MIGPTLGLLEPGPIPAPKRARKPRKPPAPDPELTRGTVATGKRNQRRSTFDAPATDLWTRYANIEPRSARWIAFIEGECIVPTGRFAGKPYRILDYQRADLEAMDGQIIVVESEPRGAGKSGLGAALLVAALFDREGVQVIVASTGMRTARIAYDRAVRIIDLNPRLSEQAIVLTNATDPRVTLPTRGAELFPLPAEEKYIVGGSPYFMLVDELGYVDRATWEAMQTAGGKVEGGFLLAVGTPGLGTADTSGQPNIMYHLRTLAMGDDPPAGMKYIEHAAHPGDDPGDPATWRKANPGLGILVTEAVVALDYRTLSAARFGQMRLGIWTQHESAWMQAALWDGLEVESGRPPNGTKLALGFDGSTSGDATALVAFVIGTGRVCVLGLWERAADQRIHVVPRDEVMTTVDQAFADFDVVAMFADPWGWQSELQTWVRLYGERVQAFNTAAQVRMGPATDSFMTSVIKGEVKWDGHATLRSHMLAAIAKRTQAGDVLVKDARKRQQIDLAIGAILAKAAADTAPPAPNYYSG